MKSLRRWVAFSLLFFAVAIHASEPEIFDPVAAGQARLLEFDLPELHVGVAEYPDGPTGTTVFYFPQGVQATIDVRGGRPGTLNAAVLMQAHASRGCNAVAFSGGSSYGLSTATGVANAIKEEWSKGGERPGIAGVAGVILNDLGPRRYNTITPDERLGRAALEAARPGVFPLGPHGAGRYAIQGGFFGPAQHSGQGGAYKRVGDTKIAVFTVVNSFGGVVDREGLLVRCRASESDDCPPVAEAIRGEAVRHDRAGREDRPAEGPTTENTTLTLLVTNEVLSVFELDRLAVQVHTSMSRAIQPFSTRSDGDVLIAVTTGEVETESLTLAELGLLASEVAWDAVLASVPELPAAYPAEPVEWTDEQRASVVGSYRLSSWASFEIREESGQLSMTTPPHGGFHLPSERTLPLRPIGTDLLLAQGQRRTRVIRVDRAEGRVVGLAIKPGPWEQRATRE